MAATPSQPMVLNGAHGEGGGALLRTALVMSTLTQRPMSIHNIRGAMRRPGLNSEDLTVIRALTSIANAEVEGDEVGSDKLIFTPRSFFRSLNRKISVYAFEKGQAVGSAVVVAHALLPVFARSGCFSQITIEGETHGESTLSFDPFDRVTGAVHRQQGLYFFPTLSRAGYGPGSHGEIRLEVEPSALEPVRWERRGELEECRIVVTTSGLDPEIAERGVEYGQRLFQQRGLEAEVEVNEISSREPGAFITILAKFETGMGAGTAIAKKGVRMESVVDRAFDNFDLWFDGDAAVDHYLADQMLIPAALAEGPSAYTTPRITRRLITMAWIIRQFMPIHITIHGREGEPGRVTVDR